MESLQDLLVMIKKAQDFIKFSCFFNSTWKVTQCPCKNRMPLYITVLIYNTICMKQSSYWVICAPLKQSRVQISSYGIQDQNLQLWNKFLSLRNIGIYFFSNPLISPSISKSYHEQVHQKKTLQTKAWEKKCQKLNIFF